MGMGIGGGAGQMQLQSQMQMELARKGVTEAWAAAGWGGKKMVEDYEVQRDKLLDPGLNLGKAWCFRPPPPTHLRAMC